MRILLASCALSLALYIPALAKPVVTDAAWTSEGLLVTIGPDRKLRLHDGSTGKVLTEVTAPGEATTYVSFSPDSGTDEPNELSTLAVSGSCAVTCGTDGKIQWWTLPELKMDGELEITYHLRGLSAAANGTVVAYTDTSTRYLDSSMELVRRGDESSSSGSFPDLVPPDSSETFGVPRLSPDGHWAIARVDDFVRLWDLSQADISSVVLKNTLEPLALGKAHFYAEKDGRLTQFAYATPDVPSKDIPVADATRAAVDQEETRLVVRDAEAVWIVDLTRDAAPKHWQKKPEALTLSPDGKKLGLWYDDTFEVWAVDTEQKLFDLPVPKAEN